MTLTIISPDHGNISRHLTRLDMRRPVANPSLAGPRSFAVLSPSGEMPLVATDRQPPRPDTTARIVVTRIIGAEPVRPRWYRGVRRLDRHRAALLAARGGIGGSR